MRKQGQHIEYITIENPAMEDTSHLKTPRKISDMEIIHTTHERAVSSGRPSSAQNTPKVPTKKFYQRLSTGKSDERGPRSRSNDPPRDTFWPTYPSHSRAGSEDLPRPKRPSSRKREGGNTDFHKLLRYQQDMREGNLEKAEPPADYRPEQRGRLAPPRPAGGFSSAPSTRPTTPQVLHRKTKSSSKKFVDYIRTSADYLDETRRDITGKISPPFNGTFKNKPFTLHRKSSSTSVDSFYCAGEQEKQGEWPAIAKCRLCKVGSEGPRGLCASCEDDHRRPSLGSDDWEVPRLGSGSDSGSDRRPTPPPKDQIYFTASGQRVHPSTLELAEDEMRVKLGYVAKHHRVITPPSSRRGSIPIMIMGDEIAVQDAVHEESAAKSSNTWSTIYGSGDFEYFEKEDPEQLPQQPLPLKLTKDQEKVPCNRNTNFYKFYDDIL
ncbi:hypothetical protein GLAREA_06076 [Glarea lozoyensis ATCC 20868]|uniref:Uncharacterized protein n=1 Tax=Glarea lozoyensis (strain ATCC 20868 / MF5171) TaxID=1116229 RepID=S3D7F3_GLAL2|nr:uncharacterized protein GLAREA_06076 [Glarea lozoyensis ATCC 20868]EPE33064.1 hypothetical protein GLAREA_06076 [Glarea lozoyensis ATCC 20868]